MMTAFLHNLAAVALYGTVAFVVIVGLAKLANVLRKPLGERGAVAVVAAIEVIIAAAVITWLIGGETPWPW